MAGKTNAARLLDKQGVAYDLVEYPVDDEHLDAMAVARAIGAPPEAVFKTLVAVGSDGEVRVFCVPGSAELDLKKAAAACGVSRVSLIPVAQLKGLTGYVRGGCSPIGMTHHYPTFIDEIAAVYNRIYVSAGRRGLQLHIDPTALRKVTDASFADLA
jgi:Cys-tRNA(Pro)/Cys-tRNA(Cys) deacylase